MCNGPIKLGAFFYAMVAIASLCVCNSAQARKTNQALYEDPFDTGAGGASLTYASREAVLFANPAQLPYGETFHRRFTMPTFQLLLNKESQDFASNMSGAMGGTSEEEGEESDVMGDLIEAAMDTPIHVGANVIPLAWLLNNGGFATFARAEADVMIRKIGDSVLPDVQYEVEAYGGGVISLASRTPWRWLSLGATYKYVGVIEEYGSIQLPDLMSGEEGGLPEIDESSMGMGSGYDIGALIFVQGSTIDWRLALKVDDVGGTKLSGDSPTELKQVASAGTSLTFHTGADALHLALDYRDILGVYKKRDNPEESEELFKRVYTGAKVLLRTYIGISAGLYNGYQSYGVALDFIFMRLGAVMYTRELGDEPGVDPRNIYRVDFSMGF